MSVEKHLVGNEKMEDLDFEVVETEEKCLVKEGKKCLCPISKFKIEGYKFECHWKGCNEEVIGNSKDEVLNKAKNHLFKHFD